MRIYAFCNTMQDRAGRLRRNISASPTLTIYIYRRHVCLLYSVSRASQRIYVLRICMVYVYCTAYICRVPFVLVAVRGGMLYIVSFFLYAVSVCRRRSCWAAAVVIGIVVVAIVGGLVRYFLVLIFVFSVFLFRFFRLEHTHTHESEGVLCGSRRRHHSRQSRCNIIVSALCRRRSRNERTRSRSAKACGRYYPERTG